MLQVLFDGGLNLEASVNRDYNTNAMIFGSQLLEKGDVFKRNAYSAYTVLLRAQILGGTVLETDLKRLRAQLSQHEIEWSEKDARNIKSPLQFSLSPITQNLNKSRLASKICKFVP